MKTEQIELLFLKYFNEIESFGLRSERFYDDYSANRGPESMTRWLRAAFCAGIEAGRHDLLQRSRCNLILQATLGKALVQDWWSKSNTAFSDKTPDEQWQIDPDVVYQYLSSHLDYKV